MTRWWMLAAIAAAVGVVGEARAGDETRLAMELVWRHVPRKGSDLESRQSARLPGAKVDYYLFTSGVRAFNITFDSGVSCASHARKGEVVMLQCGETLDTLYELTQVPGKQTVVDWITLRGGR